MPPVEAARPALAPIPTPTGGWRAPAAGVASALALFCAAVMAVMLIRYAQERHSDPLNDGKLVALRERFVANPESDAFKAEIRERDLHVRKTFFSIQGHLNAGAWLLVLGLVPLVVLLNVLILTRAPAPSQEECLGASAAWKEQDQQRRGLAAFVVALVLLAALAAVILGKG
jgi:hypothetical protein